MSCVMGSEEPSNTTAASLSGNNTNSNTNNAHTTANSNSTKSMKIQRGGISESSTTSDNTTDFIEIVKKHDIVYNTHHPDYKNVEVKSKIWTQIAEEIGLSVDASKRKWKNLRDSYTKYLRSYRVGTKTSKKYQFWAHAEHMDFLKPYQGPGRSSTNVGITKEEEDNECDLGFQVLSKATANAVDEDELKQSPAKNNATKTVPLNAITISNMLPNYANNCSGGLKTSGMGLTMPTGGTGVGSAVTSISGTLMLPVPSLPTVQLPPSLTAKPILTSIPSTSSSSSTSVASTLCSSTSNSYSTAPSLATLTTTSLPSQVFTLPQLSAKGPIPMPSSNTASSVGCLIIEPQLFASADTFKKEFNNSSSLYSSSTAQISSSGLQIYPNGGNAYVSSTAQTMTNRINPPLITKIRRVQPSPQSSAINLSFPTTPSSSATTSSTLSSYQTNGYSTLPSTFMPTLGSSTSIAATAAINGSGVGQPPTKKFKTADVDISAILQANRDLDANTLFFLSLARSVRSMPTKFQSLAKMRCMRIVSDIELELDNVSNEANNLNTKYCTNDTDSPPAAIGNSATEAPLSEHFVYVMSPSRVEGMIDLSSDEEHPSNNGN